MVIYRLNRRLLWIGVFVACNAAVVKPSFAAEPPNIAEHLRSGRLADAQNAMTAHVSQEQDDLARFQLGAVQFFIAVERLAQDSFRYGLNPDLRWIPFLRTPIKPNPNPEPVRYEDARAMIAGFVERLEQAQTTLAPINDNALAWKLDLTAVRLDLDGDGQAAPEETLWGVFQQFALTRPQPQRGVPESFTIGLDSADVHWLRGYCHLLSALGEVILAYDYQRQFDHTAQLFFANPQTPYAVELTRPADDGDGRGILDDGRIFDAIAFIHLANFPLHEPARLTKARDHLLAMVDTSRKSWDLIERETDNDREWIPGPDQTSVVEGVAMDKERLAAWRRFLDEAEAVLNGKKLIPFWRGNTDRGINLMKAFTEPKDFDLVLWVQGTAALPYLEDGEVTCPQT
jgi:hypothetical protein